MQYQKAYKKFGDYYKDRYTVEFPTIFNLCNFRGKIVLEIGAGREGFFAKKVAKHTKKYVATDISANILNDLKKNVNVETKVCRAEKLPFQNNSFDIVFSRWVAQNVDNLKLFVKEMCRVSKCCVIIVLPSEHGDQTKMMQIKYKNKYKYRKERIQKIMKWMKKSGFNVKVNKKVLKFVFPSIKEAAEVLSAIDFENKLNKKQKEKIEKFLLKRKKGKKIHFTQGAAFIYGCK